MKKKLLSIFVILSMIFSMFIPISASASSVSVTIDGVPVAFNDSTGYPFVDSANRTQVPLRAAMEAYGCKVDWINAPTYSMIYVSKDGTHVSLIIGSKYIKVNGKDIPIDTAAIIKNNRTYLPIRAVLEAFKSTVTWNQQTQTVSITSPKELPESQIDSTWTKSLAVSSSGSSLEDMSSDTSGKTYHIDAKNNSVYISYTSNPWGNSSGRIFEKTENEIKFKWVNSAGVVTSEHPIIIKRQTNGTILCDYGTDESPWYEYLNSDISIFPGVPDEVTADVLLTANQTYNDCVKLMGDALVHCGKAINSNGLGMFYAFDAQNCFKSIKSKLYNAIQKCGNYEIFSDLKSDLKVAYDSASYQANFSVTDSNYKLYVTYIAMEATQMSNTYQDILNDIKAIMDVKA